MLIVTKRIHSFSKPSLSLNCFLSGFGPALYLVVASLYAHKCVIEMISCFTAYQILSTDARNLSSNRTHVSVHFQVQRSAFSCPSSALNVSTLHNFFCVLAW